jgi:hypothetical protein
MQRRMRSVLLVVIAAAVLAGCGASSEALQPVEPAPPASTPPVIEPAPAAIPVVEPQLPSSAAAPARSCAPGDEKQLRSGGRAYAALARAKTIAYARPGGRRLGAFEPVNANDYPTVFGVLAEVVDKRCRPAWYRVQLPMRPNGVTGFVAAGDVELVTVRTRIEVDLSERRLDYFRNGEKILTAIVAVGATITPTPTGSYYVNQRLEAPDPWGPFGPAALGISAFSPVLQDWAQGGPIAIHGTNDPSSVGLAVSHGCLRVKNETLVWLYRHTRAGTPVEIRA